MSHHTLVIAMYVADVLMKATVVLAIAWSAVVVARKASAAIRHLIWTIALGILLVLPIFEVVAPRTVILNVPERQLPPAVQPSVAVVDLAPTSSTTTPFESTTAQPPQSPSRPDNLVSWALGAWLGGCAVVAFSTIAGLIMLRRIKASPLSMPNTVLHVTGTTCVRLALSREGRPPSALTWGTLRPTILLPRSAEDWPAEKLETVLFHEFEHVRRRDAAIQLAGMAACALYWFHPGVWLAAKAVRAEAEAATDDAVLRRGVKPSAYANTLLEVAAEISRHPRLATTTGVAFMNRSKIEARLRAILDGRTRKGISKSQKVLAGTLALAIMVPLAFVRAAAIAPFATSPEQNDPIVRVQVKPHSEISAAKAKRLAVAKAHHARALAKLALFKSAPGTPLAVVAKASGLTLSEVEQAMRAGQASDLVADRSGEIHTGNSRDLDARDAVELSLNLANEVVGKIGSKDVERALTIAQSEASKAALDSLKQIQLDANVRELVIAQDRGKRDDESKAIQKHLAEARREFSEEHGDNREQYERAQKLAYEALEKAMREMSKLDDSQMRHRLQAETLAAQSRDRDLLARKLDAERLARDIQARFDDKQQMLREHLERDPRIELHLSQKLEAEKRARDKQLQIILEQSYKANKLASEQKLQLLIAKDQAGRTRVAMRKASAESLAARRRALRAAQRELEAKLQAIKKQLANSK